MYTLECIDMNKKWTEVPICRRYNQEKLTCAIDEYQHLFSAPFNHMAGHKVTCRNRVTYKNGETLLSKTNTFRLANPSKLSLNAPSMSRNRKS